MLRNISKLEVEVNGKMYVLLAEMDSPIDEFLEAVNKFSQYGLDVKENYLKSQKEKQEQEQPQVIDVEAVHVE